MSGIASSVETKTPKYPSFFVTLSSAWTITILVVATLVTGVSARLVADRINTEKIVAAEETMSIVEALARDMNRAKPHEFISSMIATGQFSRMGIYCSMQKVNIDGSASGITKDKAPFPLAAAAMETETSLTAVSQTEISISRPLYGKNEKLNGAVYMVIEKASYTDVLRSLAQDIAGYVLLITFIVLVIVVIIAKSMSKPIALLTQTTSRIAHGALDTHIQARGPSELRSLSESVASMVGNLKENLSEINRLAFVDTVTKLPNRADFLKRGSNALNEKRECPGSTIAVLFIDLDGFKFINDSYGHDMGDKTLRFFAEKLNDVLRETDGILNVPDQLAGERTETSLPARLGGDEFTVLLTGLICPAGADVVASRILSMVAKPFQIDGVTLHLGASIGIATADAENADFDVLLFVADEAMYEVKRAGKKNFKRVECLPELVPSVSDA